MKSKCRVPGHAGLDHSDCLNGTPSRPNVNPQSPCDCKPIVSHVRGRFTGDWYVQHCKLHANAALMLALLERVYCSLTDLSTSKDFDTTEKGKDYLNHMHKEIKDLLAKIDIIGETK